MDLRPVDLLPLLQLEHEHRSRISKAATLRDRAMPLCQPSRAMKGS